MDYGRVLSRAWEITWRWKVLWIFGFLSSLGQGSPGNSSYSFSGQEANLERYFQGAPEQIWTAIGGVVLAILCLLLIVAIILWVVSIISRGALIAGVVQVEDEGSTSFGNAWAVGRRKFWTLLGLGVLAALPLIILIIVLSLFFAVGIAAGVGLLDVQEGVGIATIVLVSVVCGGLLCCGLVLLGIVLEQIRVYSERAAILEDLGWIEAFKRGWQVITDNLGPTIVYWFIFFALGLVIFAISFGLVILLFAPFLVMFGIREPGTWAIGPALCVGFLAFIFFALLRSVVTTYISASWTLAYRQLTGQPAAPELEGATI